METFIVNKYDKIGRIAYQKISDHERVIFKYYGDTTCLKIKMKLFEDTISHMVCYNQQSKEIVEYNGVKLKVFGLTFFNESVDINMTLPPSMIQKMKTIIKANNIKKSKKI